jgi:hypothetical protein
MYFLVSIDNVFQLPSSLYSKVWCQVVVSEIEYEENLPIGVSSSPVIVVVILFKTFNGVFSMLTAFCR